MLVTVELLSRASSLVLTITSQILKMCLLGVCDVISDVISDVILDVISNHL